MKRALQRPQGNGFPTYRTERLKGLAVFVAELLEPRLVLSGSVLATVFHGTLNIRGDSAANAIVMDQIGLQSGQVRVSGSSGTAVNHQADPVVVSGITRGVFFQSGKGADSLTMSGVSLPGSVSVSGADTLAISSAQIAGSLDISDTSGLSATTAIANATVGKNLSIQGSQAIVMQSVLVQRTTKITGTSRADHLAIDDSTFHGGVQVSTGQGADVVEIESHGNALGSPTQFDGPASISLGAGNDILQLGINRQAGNASIFAGSVHLRGGAGLNTLADFAASTLIGKSRLQIRNFGSRTPAPDTTDPAVSSTTPAANATGVALNRSIAAIFSEPMDPSTITSANVSVTAAGGILVAGTISYIGTTMTFTPTNNLAPNTVFTGTITTAAEDLAGNPLANNFVWTFTTGVAPDTTAPTVSFTNPANNATAVPLNRSIAVTFSEAMDPSTINSSNVTVTAPGGIAVLGTVAYAGNTMTFTPTLSLAPHTTFTGTVATGARDLAGNPLANSFAWSFATGAASDTTDPTVSSTNPANNATGVALNRSIAVTFSEAMDPLTITSANVTVTAPGSVAVQGTVGYAGTTMTFTPTSPLVPSTVYTGTITVGAKDLAENPLANSFVWSFTTGATADTTDPTVSSTNPADNATGVALNASIAATFSEAMDPLTITSANVTVTAPGSVAVQGTVGYAGTTMTFTPTSDLAPNTVYTGTITVGATDLAGNPLANSFVWSFTTGATPDTTPPTVASTSPADLQHNVFINDAVAATFSEAIDPLTITAATFTVTAPGNASVAGSVNFDSQSDIATFTPSSNLASNTTFTATISGGINGAKDLAGNALVNDKVWTFTTNAQLAQAPVNLGSAAAFAVMATTAISSIDPTVINGDVGLSPGTSQGIPTGDVNGSIHVGDQAIVTAQADLLSAYNDAVSRSLTSVALAGNMGGSTFTPGLYTNSSSVSISGSGSGNNVTLDALGNPNAIFIFKMGSTLTTGPGAQVILAGGAKAGNVFWQVGTSATLDTTTIFKGNLLAAVSITVNSGSVVEGRLLAGSNSSGAVTIDQSVVSVPTT